MDLEKIYPKITIADLISYNPKQSDELKYRQMIKKILKVGLHSRISDLLYHINLRGCDYNIESHEKEIILEELLLNQRNKQDGWPKYTDCDKLFIVIRETVKKFPNVYYWFSPLDPRNMKKRLENKHPNIKFGFDKGDSVIIFMNINHILIFLHGNKHLSMYVFGSDHSYMDKIVKYIIKKLHEISSKYFIKPNFRMLDEPYQIEFTNFHWRFRYPPEFFDKYLQKIRDILNKYLNSDMSNLIIQLI